MPLPAVLAAVGAAAQIGESLTSFFKGRKRNKELDRAYRSRPLASVQSEIEANRALALNRYNATNPYIGYATNNLNKQSADATGRAMRRATDSAAALEAMVNINDSMSEQNQKLAVTGDQMNRQDMGIYMDANRDLAREKTRVWDWNEKQKYLERLQRYQEPTSGDQSMMNALGGIQGMAGDMFGIAANDPQFFNQLFK